MWLIIAEKDNAARRIAQILFRDVRVRKINNVNVYFSQKGDAVIGLRGHIVEPDFPKEYNDWRRVPLKSLLKAKIIRRIKERNIVETLKILSKDVKHVTIATDYDREGELIGFEALKILRNENKSITYDRARFSALTPTEVKRAFSNRTQIDYNLVKAAETRQIIDLMWGAILTRLISLSSGRMGKEFLSVGRVQTPTLRFIVEREREIREFKPKPYWEITADFGDFKAKHAKRFTDKREAEETLKRIGDFGVVRRFEERELVERKPIPFNTTEFLREAAKLMPPDRAMSIAEELYMEGLISYPRTDNTVYPESIDLKSIVESFLSSDFGKEAEIALSDMNPSRGKKETKDHPPIHPVGVAKKGELSKEKWVIYELIVRRFLATLSPNAVWILRRAEIESNGEVFKAFGKELVRKGWRDVYVYSKIKEEYLPKLSEGRKLRILAKKLHEKKTKPPSRFSASTLIKLMERYGLGTKSTRHEILRKLYSRKYVRGNPLKPTEIAFAVIEALKKEAELITLPEMTSKLEEEMNLIEEGKLDQRKVIKESSKFLEEILERIDEEKLSKILREGVKRDKIIGTCPECGGDLVIKRAKGRFVGCSNYPKCSFSLPLPQKGRIFVTDKICEKHGIRILRIKSWSFCPLCYVNR